MTGSHRRRRTHHPRRGHVAGQRRPERITLGYELNRLPRAPRRRSGLLGAGTRPSEQDDKPEAGSADEGNPFDPAVNGHHSGTGKQRHTNDR